MKGLMKERGWGELPERQKEDEESLGHECQGKKEVEMVSRAAGRTSEFPLDVTRVSVQRLFCV